MIRIGCVDTLMDTCISGWAADPSDLDDQVFVDILINSVPVATLRAAIFREDLRQAGIGDGCKGFHFDPRPYLRAGRNDVEVRYAGADVQIERGEGRIVARRRTNVAPTADPFIAALEAYYQFNPQHHVCEIATGHGRLQSAIRAAQLPFRKYTTIESPAQLTEHADLIVCSGAFDSASPDFSRTFSSLLEHHTHRPCYLAVDFLETEDCAAEVRRTFLACGVPAVKFDSILPVPGGDGRLFAFAEVEAPTVAGSGPAPLLGHVHVPKCAGTSFRILLERYFGPRHMRLYIDDTYFVYGVDDLRHRFLQHPDVRAFSCHHVRWFPRWLAGREMLYVTFLRDPIQQFVSYMTHIKKHFSGITSRSLLESVPPYAPRLTSREFAKWLLTQDRDIPFRENHNVNFFARHTFPQRADRLEAAQEALSSFFFVGVTERMDESVGALRQVAQAEGLDFPPGPISIENTSSDFRDDLSWINPDDQVGRMLLSSVELDQQLYDWAVARLNENFWAGQSPRKRQELSAENGSSPSACGVVTTTGAATASSVEGLKD